LGNEIVSEAFSIPLYASNALHLNALIAPEISVWQPIFILLPLGGGRSCAPCGSFLVRTSVLSYAVTIDRDLAVKIKDASYTVTSCRDSVLKIKDMLKSLNPFESCNDDACYSLNASGSTMKDQNPLFIVSFLEACVTFDPGGFATSTALGMQTADNHLLVS
jgi:hypothetical protein